MVVNADKCHFMCFSKDTENQTFILNNSIFNNSNEEIQNTRDTIDNEVTFKGHNFQFLNKVTV